MAAAQVRVVERAAGLLAQIDANVGALFAGRIPRQDFDRRQRMVWDEIRGAGRAVEGRVLKALQSHPTAGYPAKLKRKAPGLLAGIGGKQRRNIHGVLFVAPTAVRAIREGCSWRIDRCGVVSGAWLPWEAIDEHLYGTSQEADAAIQAWLRAPAE